MDPCNNAFLHNELTTLLNWKENSQTFKRIQRRKFLVMMKTVLGIFCLKSISSQKICCESEFSGVNFTWKAGWARFHLKSGSSQRDSVSLPPSFHSAQVTPCLSPGMCHRIYAFTGCTMYMFHPHIDTHLTLVRGKSLMPLLQSQGSSTNCCRTLSAEIIDSKREREREREREGERS